LFEEAYRTSKTETMTHKLIKIDNYLLVVDNSEIKEGDYYWNKEYPSQVYKRHHYKTSSDYKKIIAHLPLNGSPILEGVDLLPPYSRHQKDGVDEAEKAFTEVLDSETKQVYDKILLDATEHGFIVGYNKAREKYKYTEEDMIICWNTAYIDKHQVFGDQIGGYHKKFIQSLHQYPTKFECEMIPCNPIKYTTEDHLDVEPKTITTAQGRQWVGKYK
jgi:hypothetical protein